MPFEITVQVFGLVVPSTIIDEGASVSILSSTTWQAFGSPPLVPVTQNLLAFNKRTSQPLGILPRLPVTLGGKTIHMDVMVVPGPLDSICSWGTITLMPWERLSPPFFMWFVFHMKDGS